MPTPRDDIQALQRELAERLHEEARRLTGRPSRPLDRYQGEYLREVRRYRGLSSFRHLVGRVLAADVVYQGDYHTLALSQKAAVKILERALRVTAHVTLACEMVCARYQEVLDRWLAGELDDAAFLAGVEWERTWGFPWEHHRPILDLARAHLLPVVAINSDPFDHGDRLRGRDAFAAEIVARYLLEHPGRLLYVIDGDLHVARRHLPREVDRLLAASGTARRKLIVYQNVDAIFWQLAAEGLDRTTDVVEVDAESLCLVTATPMFRLQSYLNWAQDLPELPAPRDVWDDEREGADLADRIHALIKSIAEFFALPGTFDDFSVYTAEDLSAFIAALRSNGYSAAEIEEVKRRIASNESYFFPRGRMIYLANLSLNHAAEEAAHYINDVCAGSGGDRRVSSDDFYARILREAAGFMGSNVINPRRRALSEDEYRAFVVRYARRRRLSTEERQTLAISRLLLEHREYERRVLSGGRKRPEPRRVIDAPIDVYLGVAHGLGYLLGERLFAAMALGKIDKEIPRRLFLQRFDDEGTALRIYLALLRRVEEMDGHAPSKEDRF